MHHHHHRGGGMPVAPPPPPVLTSRSSRGALPSRPSVRSRSRSRSPASRGRYSRTERDRDLRDREPQRERERERDRDRRRSPSPYGGGSRGDRDRERDRDRKHLSSSSSSTATKGAIQPPSSNTAGLESLPSISLIQADPAASIIRRILNPEDVKIPRRVNEGSRPIFDREELREAMLRRMRANDNEENPPLPNTYIQEPAVTQQRVVAIIREPVGGGDVYLASKDPAFHAVSAKLAASSTLQTVSPDPVRANSSYHRRASPVLASQPSTRNVRGGRHVSPPAGPSRGRSSLERERIILERQQMQRAIDRERETGRPIGRGERGERIPSRERDLREPVHHREREKPTRFSGPSVESRLRSRSPISRVLREDVRIRRRSRSHSVTPPPMPEEIRRQLIERQRNIDLRTALSRQPGKYLPPHEDRVKGRPGVPIRGGGGGRGRGGFRSGGRARDDERRVWVHDMYEGDEEPKKGN